MTQNIWLLDRSRYEAGFRCQRLRWLNYHSGPEGKGYSPKEGKIPLLRGIYVHEGLAEICKVLQANKEVDDTTIRMAASYAVTRYKQDIKKRGKIEGVLADHFAFTVAEQAHLIEALIWAWARVMLPIFKEELEVVAVEQEEYFDVTDEASDPIIRVMSRPDIVCRAKTGLHKDQLGLHDFKTKESRINEWWINQWRDSPQMAIGTLATERRLGEPVSHYYLHGLIIGGRDNFARAGQTSPQERQYSPLCYARIYPPNPPLSECTTWDYKGYWVDKVPVWEAEFSQKPPDQSIAEFWVKKMPQKQLDEIFVYAGPYERQETMIQHLPAEIAGVESDWIRRMWELYEAEGAEEALDRLFPRSYNCWYGKYRCGFYGPCREGRDWKEYETRTPHHTPEEEASKG